MKLKMKTLSILFVALVAGFFTSCMVNDDDMDTNMDGKGIVTFLLTDAPFPTNLVAEANVTIDKIEIRTLNETGTAAQDSSQFMTIAEGEMEFNLLDLRNGVTAVLAEVELEDGTYDFIRMHVVDASVVLNDDAGTTYDLKIPSGSSSGLKLKLDNPLVVTEGSVTSVLLDFDVSKSFIVQGNANSKAGIKGFTFKPVVRAVVQHETGSVEGHVTTSDTIAVTNATVEFYRQDTLVTSALTDTTGYYAVIGLPTGQYDIRCMAEGYADYELENTIINASGTKTIDIDLEIEETETGETTE